MEQIEPAKERAEVFFPLWEIDRRIGYFSSSGGVRVRRFNDLDELWERLEQFDTDTYISPTDDRVFLDGKGRRLSFGLHIGDTPEIYRFKVLSDLPRPEDIERMKTCGLPIVE